MAASRIVLFDGDCTYCNGWVRWISKRDRDKAFTFLPLASPEGAALRKKHDVPWSIDSVVLIENDSAWTRSDAAWRILQALQGWSFASLLLRLVPGPLRNWGYDLIARNRHRLGMADHCEIPERRPS